MIMRPRRAGATRMEVLAGLVCAAVASAVAVLGTGTGDDELPRTHPMTVRDATQLEEIQQAMIIFAREFNGLYPRPGLIDRLPDPKLGEVPGRGAEDVSQNTTANLYAAMIAQSYFAPELVVSPVERNPKVTVMKDPGYDFDKYNPVEDQYWDNAFAADLETGSNVSYAHQPLTRDARTYWSDQMHPTLAQLGNRGPEGGTINPESYTCGPHGHWAGNIAFGDNHLEFFTSTMPEEVSGADFGDNLFAADEARKLDALLAFTKRIVDGKAELQFD